LGIRIVHAGAGQSHAGVDRDVPDENQFGRHWLFNWNEKQRVWLSSFGRSNKRALALSAGSLMNTPASAIPIGQIGEPVSGID
jgi:hypothetical protein